MSFFLIMTLFINLIISATTIFLYECRIANIRRIHEETLDVYEEQFDYFIESKERLREIIIAYCDKSYEESTGETPNEATDD